MRKTAKRHAKQIEHDLHHDLEKIKKAIYDTTEGVKGRAGEFISDSYDDLRENALETRDYVSEYITERPFKSLGIALLSGVILGYLLKK